MKLFEDKERTRQEPKKQGEADFAFYDSCAWPSIEIYRQLINGWIAGLPESEQAEMVARMKDSDSTYYQAALAELTLHAALLKLGYQIEIHPDCPHPTRKPDFLVKTKDGVSVAYIEVTTFGPTLEAIGMSNREAAIYNAIDKVKLPPGFRLSYDALARGASSPNLNNLCAEIEKWAAENAQEDSEIMPVKTFLAEDWQIELTLVGGFKKDVPVERSIGSAMGDVRQVRAAEEIRAALKKKGSRYGDFAHPYVVVVVDCKGELAGGESNADNFIEAVHGTVHTEVRTFADGAIETEDKRRNNGYWGFPDSPRHPNVSAAIVLPRPHLWDLREDRWQPLIMRHPWATHPLPDEVLPLPGWKLNEEGEFAPIEGTRLADILELPEPWPPED
ncbi:conserved hypothetical protein [Bradyrhizobium sp. STM 3843]|uniref:hypothetical protein n=1 Tax=Bradyrhizobium sp. STM 3843 TaxID=551947 RepID=UPI0002404C6C|nr:hypothetical protein [Bradyrhizobium sp. STM 3843]CCE08076.1 conserved hypothetical protein [Bradyrhizobium sp. STM 3843]